MIPSYDPRSAVLFLMRSPAYVRNFESVLRALAARGHDTTVLFEEHKEGGDRGGLALIGRLCGEYGALRYEFLRPLPLGVRGHLRMTLKGGQDYLRYFDLPYHDATRLRSRALASLPAGLERALASTLRRWPGARRALTSAAGRVDGWLGDDRAVRHELERRRPGALIVTPMVQFRSRQSDWVRAARGLGIATMLCVHSWDNLTNKGLMHAQPERVAVWNDAQRRQAVELHGAAGDSVLVAGAWPYEHWFGWRVSRSRGQLCRQLELPEERAMILYVCSSRFIAEREQPVVTRWIRALRSSEDPRVATANVIVRPHPLNSDEWSDPSLGDLPGVAVFPLGGADPVDDSSRADYFDSIAHADAVVGINTSALIESAIVDRPTLALPAPELRSSQEELPHFRQLVGEQGMLEVSASIADHVAQLSQTLADPSEGAAQRQRFVETFIRPRGSSPSPTERVVAGVEELLDAPGAGGGVKAQPAATMQA
jgi:hypothetical protein